MRRFRARNRRGQKQGFQTLLHETENHGKEPAVAGLQSLEQRAKLTGSGRQSFDVKGRVFLNGGRHWALPFDY